MIVDQLETERLTFRRLVEADKEIWMEFCNTAEALTFLCFEVGDPKALDAWFEKQWGRYQDTNSGLCAMIHKDTGELIGQCGLLKQEIDGQTEWEVGYHVIPKFWKKGYGSEAAIGVKEMGFRNQVAPYIISTIHVDNVASQIVARRNGMKIWKQTTFMDLPVQIWRQFAPEE